MIQLIGNPNDAFDRPPRPICHCLGVDELDIRSTIEQQDLVNVRQVTTACGAGGGCTACHRHIKRYIAEHRAEQAAAESEVIVGFA